MIILSVDLGRARTGIAVCDSGEVLASPVTVIAERDRGVLRDEICRIAQERGAEMIVVGLPKNMDGTEGDSAVAARNFADRLRDESGLPVEMCDERGTTLTAHQYLNADNVRGQKRKAVVDAVAAVIILEDYMRGRHNAEK